ncbi:sensor histidine kinase [Butyrivibrio sp. AE3009]|uniref:sensor histidine kinase n=1 Tax=Butyrivibrio sp. AE3009 TaxID=1280666 RepID=UPI0003B5EF76|nr:GHKL domain-containing protein [Butyrivibrio sp. AE3009]
MNLKLTSAFSFYKWKHRYSIKELIEFENDPNVVEQRKRTISILFIAFIIYSISATIPALMASYGHAVVTNIFVQLFLLTNLILVRTTRKHTNIAIFTSFGLCLILFLSFITETDWTIGMDAYWLFVLILPFVTNYLAGVIYGGISALSGFVLSVTLFYTDLVNYLQPYGRNMVQWFPIIYLVAMFTAAVIEYELTAYQIDKKLSDEKLAYFQNERTRRLKEQLSIYQNNEQVIRRYKHDLRHYNRVLASLIQEKEYDKAAEYLREFDSMLEQVTVVSFCENSIVNELLTIYASRCQKLGFKMRVKAMVPERFPMEETDLTSLVANALENAVEAQERVDADKRQIKIEIVYNGKKLKLMTQNPVAVATSFGNDGLPISTRDIPSGIGSHQIKSIAEKYSGAASFTQEGNNFILKAVMTCL